MTSKGQFILPLKMSQSQGTLIFASCCYDRAFELWVCSAELRFGSTIIPYLFCHNGQWMGSRTAEYEEEGELAVKSS